MSITPKDFYKMEVEISKRKNNTRIETFMEYLNKLEIPFLKIKTINNNGMSGLKVYGVYDNHTWSVENYDARGTLIVTKDGKVYDEQDYYFPSEAIRIIIDMHEHYEDKYKRLWKYDGCVNGQYVIPKSECDAELMQLILEFLSDHEVKDVGGYNEYMLFSAKEPFYNDDDGEYWVDCWIISDEYTY